MHARYYSPVMGRFNSVDPVGGNPWAPQSWNRYSYVMGNPINYIDPWGLTGEPANQDPSFYDEITVNSDGSSGGSSSVTVIYGGYGDFSGSDHGWGSGSGGGSALRSPKRTAAKPVGSVV